MTLVPQTKEQARARIRTIKEAAVGEDLELETLREQLAFYVQGESIDDIEARTQSLRSISNSRSLSIRSIKNSDQESPLDSYLRWLPMNYHPENDKKLWYCGWVWLEDMLRLSPLFGRATGTGSDLFHYYNRGGERFGFGPLKDYTSNAHLNLFGPSGSGKSATLVGQCLCLLALYRSRLFIIEAGNSFGLFGQFCERYGLSVNRVQVNATSKGLMAPFADTKHLVGQAIPSVCDDEALKVERLNDNDSPDDESRDILGELEIMARLMITGGEKREIDDYRCADSSMVREAIKAAAEYCHQAQCQVRPSHVRDALITFSEETNRPQARRERARLMGESMSFFCEGLEGQIFDQEAEHWPEAGVTIIDLGLYAKTGYEAQMAAAYILLINSINGIAERDQHSGRDIVTLTDEGHLTASNELLAPYAVKIVKMWRKLRAWFWLVTQDVADFPAIARKMLNNAEWWVMLTNATSAVMSLPGYYLQKRDPGLYDLMTNSVLQGKFDFDNSMTSCESMVETMGEMSKDKAYSALAKAEAWTQAVKVVMRSKLKKKCSKTWETVVSLGLAALKPVAEASLQLMSPPMLQAQALRCSPRTNRRPPNKGCIVTGAAQKR